MVKSPTCGSEKTEPIESVAEFVTCVLEHQSRFLDYGYVPFFRGHENKDFELKPSLLRNNALLENEDVMFREMIAANPSEFENDRSTFDKLARMQHYGMPTRLFDITSNPLMALYFASIKNAVRVSCIKTKVCDEACDKECDETCGKVETDGEVILIGVKNEKILFFDNDTTSVIANLARLENAQKKLVAGQAVILEHEIELFNNYKPVKRLHHFIREEKSYFKPEIHPEDIGRIICVKSKMSNQRISSQAGAFLLFGHGAELMGPEDYHKHDIIVERITINGKCKKEIRRQLDLLSINASTVYPQMESSAIYIKNKHIW